MILVINSRDRVLQIGIEKHAKAVQVTHVAIPVEYQNDFAWPVHWIQPFPLIEDFDSVFRFSQNEPAPVP